MKLNALNTKGKIIIILIVLGLVSGLALGYRQWSSTPNPAVVATVNGEKILKDELIDLLLKQTGQQGLNLLIAQKIVELEAAKQKIIVSAEDIEKELETYYTTYGGAENFTQMLALSGSSLEDIKSSLTHNLKIKKLLTPRITVTEAEMKSFFEANKESFAQEEQVKASHILVKTEKEAKELKAKLAKGEDFAALAKEFSTDPSSKDNGGQLGYFPRGEMTAEFEKAAFTLKVGSISDPVKTEYGYHLIKVEDKRAPEAANFEKNQDQIREYLTNKKLEEEYNPWLQEVANDYKIENFLSTLN
jgi:foldase protein PrsA